MERLLIYILSETHADRKTLSDEELVDIIVETKDSACFEVIYDRYTDKVFRKCLSFTKDQATAEDLAHDIFINVYVKLSAFKKKSKFSTWLYSVTYNACVDWSRAKTKKRVVDIDSTNIGEIEDEDYSIDEEMRSMQLKALDAVLKDIAPGDKAILLMKYQDGFSIIQICEMLNISESAAKMRIKRAKDSVKELYKERMKSKEIV